ncbi:MAG: chorismate mutase [Verrucomicrobiaceae bacterium]|nr:chorismate mutase [Verrucomicrobiaceae bacterium]
MKSFCSLFSLLLLSSCSSPSLPKLMVHRLEWMAQVAQVKQARSLPVTDPVREVQLIKEMETLGAEAGVPDIAVKLFFMGQIQAAKVRQEEWLATHPRASQQRQPVPDLAKTIRPALDHISKAMVTRLAKDRRSKDPEKITGEARQLLVEAGYSKAVIEPSIQGLKSGLKP